MKIYIASSWKNQHAVEMITSLLRERGHEVLSFIENNFEEGKDMDFEEWIKTDQANKSFIYDKNSAMISDLVIYIGPSGKDAAAECGMAYGKGVPIIGLYAKGEDFGLMRKMMNKWYTHYSQILDAVDRYEKMRLGDTHFERPHTNTTIET
jgi:nucleoside 2-deoxyribosyltransferase